MGALDYVWLVLGLVLVLITFWDLFQSVVLPRPAVGRIRIATSAVRWTWVLWRRVGMRASSIARREAILAIYAPAMAVGLLVMWATAMVVGYGLMLWALHSQERPVPGDFGTALYMSALSLFTLGFGDIVPTAAAARAVVLAEAATGLGMIALVISLLFSLFSSVQRREALVVTLDATAGAPPAGLQLLENCAKHDMPQVLEKTFDDWRLWAAEVLESHLAYPLLFYFRSSHDGEAWLNSFGAVMDAAVLTVSTIESRARGPALICFKVGNHFVEDVSWYFDVPHDHVPGVSFEQFQEARERLRFAGYELRPEAEAWERFQELRSAYADPLGRMAAFLAIEPTEWIGHRSYRPHLAEARIAH